MSTSKVIRYYPAFGGVKQFIKDVDGNWYTAVRGKARGNPMPPCSLRTILDDLLKLHKTKGSYHGNL